MQHAVQEQKTAVKSMAIAGGQAVAAGAPMPAGSSSSGMIRAMPKPAAGARVPAGSITRVGKAAANQPAGTPKPAGSSTVVGKGKAKGHNIVGGAAAVQGKMAGKGPGVPIHDVLRVSQALSAYKGMGKPIGDDVPPSCKHCIHHHTCLRRFGVHGQRGSSACGMALHLHPRVCLLHPP